MPYSFPGNTFDPNNFVNSLLNKMGFIDQDTEKPRVEELIKSQMTHIVLETMALYAEPYVMAEVADQYEKEKNLFFLIQKIIRLSPSTQIAILEALDKFYDETLETFNAVKS